jgi:putative SOS response-associated peptidase YedK
MCGRVIVTSPEEILKQLFDLTVMPDVLPLRYNLAPTDPIPILREPHHLELVRWGLTMKDPRHAGINAKVENLGRVYGDAITNHRCLVVTDGFFEWKRVGDKKYPFLIQRGGRSAHGVRRHLRRERLRDHYGAVPGAREDAA